MKLPYTLKAVKLMMRQSVRKDCSDMNVSDLPFFEDIDMTLVERQLAFVDAAGDLEELCCGDDPTQLAIATDCNAHLANEYLNRAFVSVTS